MAILASLPGFNLFTSLPSKPPHSTDPSAATSDPPLPPIPIPKYPPLLKFHKQRHPDPQSQQPSDQSSPSPRRRRRRGPVPVSSGVLSSDGDRSVVIGESGVSYLLPGAPFEFQYSYSETPNVKPLAIREPAFLPFAPPTMPRPWTGAAPKKTKKKKVPLYEPLNPPPPASDGVTRLELGRPIQLGRFPQEGKKREEILGEPLTKEEMVTLVKPHLHDNRQVNLGRDGLTHNMLELIHTHWKRQPICKVRCKGVPTVDMDNVCRRLEEKTWGKIIFRSGGVVYLFRGRNYNHSTRPQYPIMLWKPATPVYPKLIQEAPEGLTKDEADELRMKGKNLIAIRKLAKHGVYLSLVKDVQDAFEGSPLVKVDCKGMNPSDYKKLGAKLKDLVPCVLLSFDDEQILMWRGKGWKSMYRKAFSYPFSTCSDAEGLNVPVNPNGGGGMNAKAVTSSPRMMSLWNWAIETSKALLLDELDLGPDALLKKVEEFEAISGATDQSNLAVVQSREVHEDGHDPSHEDDESYQIASLEELDSFVPLGALPVDTIAKQLGDR